MSELLTPEELAKYLKFSDRKIERLRKDGGGPPFIKMGKHIRYPKDALQEWVRSHADTKESDTK